MAYEVKLDDDNNLNLDNLDDLSKLLDKVINNDKDKQNNNKNKLNENKK